MKLQLQFAQASFWRLEQLLLCEVYSHMLNIVDSYLEVYEYTVDVIQRIVEEAEVLNITVPEKMRKVRL